jgi:putative membrane protein
MNRIATIAAACALVFAGAAAAGGDKHAGHDMKAAHGAALPAYSDRMFFEKAALGGMTEVEAGKVAAAKGSSEDVRSFGQKMIADHSKKNEDLKALAAKKDVTLPAALDSKHQAKVTKLQSLSGEAFDSAYAADMVEGHQEMAALMKQAAASSQDADVRKFAEDTLTAVKEHHKLAERMHGMQVAEAAGE